jgi:hypothetical protein
MGVGQMTNTELSKVCRWIDEGGKLLIGRDSAGRQKIKIIHGPLGMFVHRFHITDGELEKLKATLLTHMSAAVAA